MSRAAMGVEHVAGATGSTSEAAVRALHGLPEVALIEMGDFVGGMLKYLRTHPVRGVTIAGGMAKMTKLAQGRLDLHSKRGEADYRAIAELARACGALRGAAALIASANTVAAGVCRVGACRSATRWPRVPGTCGDGVASGQHRAGGRGVRSRRRIARAPWVPAGSRAASRRNLRR